MVREGRFNRIKTLMNRRLDRVAKRVANDLKNTRPFDKEIVTVEEQIYDYNTKGFEIFTQIADTQGPEAALAWQNEMEKEIARRQ